MTIPASSPEFVQPVRMDPTPPATTRRYGRALLRLCAGALAAGLLAVVVAESLLHLVGTRSDALRALLASPADGVRYDGLDTTTALLEASPFRPRPFMFWGGYKLNSRGFRTPEYTREKAPGMYRILALGDSFTMSSGFVPLELMWHTRVGDWMKESGASSSVEVINLGVDGVGPRFIRRLFEVEGRHLAPDLVLLGLFVGNDLLDEAPALHHVPWPERWSLTWRLVARLRAVGGSAREIGAELRSQRVRWPRPGAGSPPGGHAVPGYRYDRDRAIASREGFLHIERGRLRTFELAARPEMSERLADILATIRALGASVTGVGGELVVAVIPDVVQVAPDLLREIIDGAERYDFDWPQSRLRSAFAAAGVAAVDVLPAFRSAPTEPRLYRVNDTHWSDAGNALAARVIFEFLRERRAVGSP